MKSCTDCFKGIEQSCSGDKFCWPQSSHIFWIWSCSFFVKDFFYFCLLEESDTTERLRFHFSLSCIGEGNDNPLQCSCLENPRDGGAWWAAVYGVAQRRTRLKRLSSSSSSAVGVKLIFSVISLPGFVFRYILISWNKLINVSSFTIFCKSL